VTPAQRRTRELPGLAALDDYTKPLDAGDRCELGHAHANPRGSELGAKHLGQCLGEALEQFVRVIGRKRLDALHDRRVIERVGKIVAGECFRGRQRELEIDEQRLREVLFPGVDADARLQAQIMVEDGIHGPIPRRRFGGHLESQALPVAERAL
jgi:hypothetical protein